MISPSSDPKVKKKMVGHIGETNNNKALTSTCDMI